MKKEILTTITAAEAATNTNIELQEENTMKKEYELKNFTDEDRIRYAWELEVAYQSRKHFVKDFYELYVNGDCGSERVRNALPMIINYITEFATTARVWENILQNSNYRTYYCKVNELKDRNDDDVTKKRILNTFRPKQKTTEAVVNRIYATIAVGINNATFSPSGEYRVINILYRDYKCKGIIARDGYEYECISQYDCPAAYIKTGEYNADTKTIEVYIPVEYDGENDKWIYARNCGDIEEIAAQMAAEAEAAENDNEEENDMRTELEEKKQSIIERVEGWYEDCYSYIGDLESIVSPNEDSDWRERQRLEQCWMLLGDSRRTGDDRDEDCNTIRTAIIEYLKNQPVEYFEDIDEYETDILDIMVTAYWAADFELPERPSRKEEFLEAVKNAPADVFEPYIPSYLDDDSDPEKNREKLIETYENWYDVAFLNDDYDINGRVSNIYHTMRRDAGLEY